MSQHDPLPDIYSSRLELALRLASAWHAGQTRRGSGIPYVQHVCAVAWILDRAGFPEDVVIAGLLHDAVEDTPATLEEIAARLGPEVAELVRHCSEKKEDETGKKRPWIDRKRDHLNDLAKAPPFAKAIILADKLHNLRSMEFDLRAGLAIWDLFHAPKDQVLWYNRAMVETCVSDDPRSQRLVKACEDLLRVLDRLDG